MKLDWNEFSRGMEMEMEKSAAPSIRPFVNAGRTMWNAGRSAVGQIPAIARGAMSAGKNMLLPLGIGAGAVGIGGLGYEGYQKFKGLQSAMDKGWNALSKLAPVGIMAALASGMRGNQGNRAAAAQAAASQRGPKSLLNVNPASVTSLRAPQVGPAFSIAPQAPMEVKLASIYDPLVWAARNRVANHVLNEVTKTNPLAMDLPNRADAAKGEADKHVELVTKYPELEKLLEDEQNKAYLKKLLST